MDLPDGSKALCKNTQSLIIKLTAQNIYLNCSWKYACKICMYMPSIQGKHAHIYTHTHTNIHTCVFMCVCMHIIYMRMLQTHVTNTNIYIYICIYIYISIYIHMYMSQWPKYVYEQMVYCISILQMTSIHPTRSTSTAASAHQQISPLYLSPSPPFALLSLARS